MEENKETQIKSPVEVGVQGKIIETYAEDMAKVIESDRGGLIKKIIHGDEEEEPVRPVLSPESRRNKYFMLIGILLLILALALISFFVLKKDINTVEPEKLFTPIVFNDKSSYIEVVELNRDQIVQTIFNAVGDTEVKSGGLEGIYLTENKKVVGLRRFIALIEGTFVPGAG